jgi:hypothetical protein
MVAAGAAGVGGVVVAVATEDFRDEVMVGALNGSPPGYPNRATISRAIVSASARGSTPTDSTLTRITTPSTRT